jgi:hypothetical protein
MPHAFILSIHRSTHFVFFTNVERLLNEINVKFYHPFLFDLNYYETNKLKKETGGFQFQTNRFEIYEFEYTELLLLSFDCTTRQMRLTTEEQFKSLIELYVQQMVSHFFANYLSEKKLLNHEIHIYSIKNSHCDSFQVEQLIYLHNIRFS